MCAALCVAQEAPVASKGFGNEIEGTKALGRDDARIPDAAVGMEQSSTQQKARKVCSGTRNDGKGRTDPAAASLRARGVVGLDRIGHSLNAPWQ